MAADMMTMTPHRELLMPQPCHDHQHLPPCHSCRRRVRCRNGPRDIDNDIFWTVGDDKPVKRRPKRCCPSLGPWVEFFFPVLLFIYLQLFIDLNKWRRQDRKGRETSMDSRCVAMHLKLGYVIYFILY